MTIADIQKTYREALTALYDEREARAITNIVFEKVFELQPHKLAFERFRILTLEQQKLVLEILKRLQTYEPVQYVLEEAYFFGLSFKVNPHTLIPRPETEELVAWIISEQQKRTASAPLLEIGTGSGCIAITLATKFPNQKIVATDISKEALTIARHNASAHKADVQFIVHDILQEPLAPSAYQLMVSNPPYIAEHEKETMQANVLNFEPHTALFVPGTDDLLFYKTIATKAMLALIPTGRLFFEINAAKGKEVAEIMQHTGFQQVELREDLSGRPRMIKGEKPT